MTKPLNVYIGAGNHRLKGFVHVDVNMSKDLNGTADVIADITDCIPFKDNSVDLIFSRSTFEHLTYQEQINCLLECKRILKRGGGYPNGSTEF